jgi:fructokinase
MKILSIGEIIWDVYTDTGKKCLGGAPLNLAAHCVLCGAESGLVSAVGEDELGKEAIQEVVGYGVRPFIDCVQKPTGRCVVALNENKVPQYCIERDAAYDEIQMEKHEKEILGENYDACAFGTLIQRNGAVREQIKRLIKRVAFKEIFCDINLRKDNYDKQSIEFCLSNATVLKISLEEEPTLRDMGMYALKEENAENICREICEKFKNIRHLLLTDGGNGAYAYDAKENRLLFEKSVPVKVASTVGAGDSFGAAWLCSYLKGQTLRECLQDAVKWSAFVVSRYESIPKI